MNAITAAGWAMAAGYMAQQSLLATGEPGTSGQERLAADVSRGESGHPDR